METQLNELLEAIRADYLNWTSAGGRKELTEVNKSMIEEFNGKLAVKPGRKYIKIISGNSVWGFVVAEEGGKFPKGTILKAAGWNAPATNHGRGNILEGGYTIQWTGPLYM